MIKDLSYIFTVQLWKYESKAVWFFVTVPLEESEQIKFFSAHLKRGWGSVRVKVSTGSSVWNTSIFPDSKSGRYILPIKSEIRKKENISHDDMVTIRLDISL
jgi:hypothetical protein